MLWSSPSRRSRFIRSAQTTLRLWCVLLKHSVHFFLCNFYPTFHWSVNWWKKTFHMQAHKIAIHNFVFANICVFAPRALQVVKWWVAVLDNWINLGLKWFCKFHISARNHRRCGIITYRNDSVQLAEIECTNQPSNTHFFCQKNSHVFQTLFFKLEYIFYIYIKTISCRMSVCPQHRDYLQTNEFLNHWREFNEI